MFTRIMRQALLLPARRFVIGWFIVAGSALAVHPAQAQGRDNPANAPQSARPSAPAWASRLHTLCAIPT